MRERCTHSPTGPRMLTVRLQVYHEALQAARQQQTTLEFKAADAARAGVEGMLSQGIRIGDLLGRVISA
jgi:transposase